MKWRKKNENCKCAADNELEYTSTKPSDSARLCGIDKGSLTTFTKSRLSRL